MYDCLVIAKAAIFMLFFLALSPVAEGSSPRHDMPPGATPLLPDLRTEPSNGGSPTEPPGLRFIYSRKTKQSFISFETITSNIGRGPFEIQADVMRKIDCDGDGNAKDYGVRQVVYHDLDGNRIFDRAVDAWVDWLDSGCIYVEPTHGHWHFDDLNTSFLEDSNGQVVSRVQKNSWCLFDMENPVGNISGVFSSGPFYGTVSSAYSNCTGPRVMQGLSPGWSDIYGVGTPGQVINVSNMSSGNYCIVTLIDQNQVVQESDELNNRTGTPVAIDKIKKKITRRSGTC